MKFSPKAALTACLLVLVSCGGGGDLKTRSKASANEFLSAFESIKDKESAEAAVSDLKTVIADMKALNEELEKLPKEEKEALEAEMKAEEGDMSDKMMAEMTRLMSIPGVMEVITPIMEDMQK